MKTNRIWLIAGHNGLIAGNVDFDCPPQEILQEVKRRVKQATGVEFSGEMVRQLGNLVEFPYSDVNFASSVRLAIEDVVSDLNRSELTLTYTRGEFKQIAEAAIEAYLLFNDFIQLENRVKGVPVMAMDAWNKLGEAVK